MRFLTKCFLFSIIIMKMSDEVRSFRKVWCLTEERYDQVEGSRARRTVLETELCKYLFNPDGSCVVHYEGPVRPGKVTGSCLPVRLGGDCFGLPRECVNCHQLD